MALGEMSEGVHSRPARRVIRNEHTIIDDMSSLIQIGVDDVMSLIGLKGYVAFGGRGGRMSCLASPRAFPTPLAHDGKINL